MVHLQALWQFIAGNPVTILICVVVYMIIGSIWYGPLFSRPWTRMNGINTDAAQKEMMMKAMIPGMTMSVITGFVIATVLGRGMQLLDMSSPAYPLIIATILWLPFTALPFGQNYAYLQKPFKLFLIDAGYMLVSMWSIALILYWMA